MFSALSEVDPGNPIVKKVIIYTLGVIFFMIIFPPYEGYLISGKIGENGYGFLLNMPEKWNWKYNIDYGRLFLQFIGVFICSFIYLMINIDFKKSLISNGNDNLKNNELNFNKIEVDYGEYPLVDKKEEDLYEMALSEVESENRKVGLWAKCFSESAGDENKTKAVYISCRADQLLIEQKEQFDKLSNQMKIIIDDSGDSNWCSSCNSNHAYIDTYNRMYCPVCEKYVDKV